MGEYNFTVQQEGHIFVEADSLEEAEAKLKDSIDGFYVRTEYGEQPADDAAYTATCAHDATAAAVA